MRYQIFYTAGAKRDLRSIYSYIAEELLVPDTAAGQVQRIMKEIRSLDETRYRLYDDEPWYSLGLRFFPVDNFLVFYLPDESASTVRISVSCMVAGISVDSWTKQPNIDLRSIYRGAGAFNTI